MDDKKRQAIPGHPISAEEARASGLPMLDAHWDADQGSVKHPDWLTAGRCKEQGRPVGDGERPVAYKRVCYGYVALYDRREVDHCE